MIANSRQMAVHDFLLVLLSAAVLALLLWPPSPAIRQVDIRRNDGSFQSYQLATSDPKLAKLEQELQRWSKPKASSQLAISKWQAELGGLYAERTLPRGKQPGEKKILPVSYYPDQAEKREAAAREVANQEQRHAYWLDFQRQAERSVEGEEQRQKQMLSLRSRPFITIGELQPAPYTRKALLGSSLIGFCVAMLFVTWTYLVPSIHLIKQSSKSVRTTVTDRSACNAIEPAQADNQLPREPISSLQFQVMLPAKWLKVHQPLGVWIRQATYLTLILSVTLVASSSFVSPQSSWHGFPGRVIWGETTSSSLSPWNSNSKKPLRRLQKSANRILTPRDRQS
jgi:hypothetical protein